MEEMICDFFIILVHSVLRDRGVYPKELFEEVRHDQIKSMPVPICRHPSVTRYVYESVSDLRPLLSQGKLRRLSVVVKAEESGLALESYELDVQPIGETEEESGLSAQGVTDVFKGMLMKLLYSFSGMKKINSPLGFAIFALGNTSTVDGQYDEWIEQEYEVLLPPTHATINTVKSSRVKASDGRLYGLQLLTKENCSEK